MANAFTFECPSCGSRLIFSRETVAQDGRHLEGQPAQICADDAAQQAQFRADGGATIGATAAQNRADGGATGATPGATGATLRNVVALGTKAKATALQGTEQQELYLEAPSFDAFWIAFALKRDRIRAKRAWFAAQRRGAITAQNCATIIECAGAYHAWCERTGTMQSYAQGWLNGERWNDENDTAPAVGETDPAFTVGTPEYAARVEADERRVMGTD